MRPGSQKGLCGMSKQLAVILTACMLLALGERTAVAGSSVSVKELRCEYRVNPLGIDVVRPRLNWILQSSQRGQKQTACCVIMEIVACRSNVYEDKW